MDGLAWKVYLPPEDVNSQRLIEIFFFFPEWEGVRQQEMVRGLGESACFMKKKKKSLLDVTETHRGDGYGWTSLILGL